MGTLNRRRTPNRIITVYNDAHRTTHPDELSQVVHGIAVP